MAAGTWFLGHFLLPPAAYFLPTAFSFYASGGLLFPAAGKVGKRAARHRWFLDFLCLQEFHSIGDVRGIDAATDPLPLYWGGEEVSHSTVGSGLSR